MSQPVLLQSALYIPCLTKAAQFFGQNTFQVVNSPSQILKEREMWKKVYFRQFL